jgi:hypothetical protein
MDHLDHSFRFDKAAALLTSKGEDETENITLMFILISDCF